MAMCVFITNMDSRLIQLPVGQGQTQLLTQDSK
jgi:hypothetical protein